MQIQCKNNFKTYGLKNITHLCSSGANTKKVEFRITELKSAMRFWWRAISFYEKPNDMKKDEDKIFGNSDKFKSPIIFILEQNDFYNDIVNYIVGCRKADKEGKKFKYNEIKAFIPGKKIKLKLKIVNRKISDNEYTNKTIEFYDKLLKISLILGGIGKRSRRGCGALQIETEDEKRHNNVTENKIYEQIEICMNELNVSEFYDFNSEINNNYIKIVRKSEYVESSCKYPYVEEILISKKSVYGNDFYKKVKNAIDITRKERLYYKNYNVDRLACPVYVTCYGEEDKLYPIIVKLHNSNGDKTYPKYYERFKKEIL